MEPAMCVAGVRPLHYAIEYKMLQNLLEMDIHNIGCSKNLNLKNINQNVLK